MLALGSGPQASGVCVRACVCVYVSAHACSHFYSSKSSWCSCTPEMPALPYLIPENRSKEPFPPAHRFFRIAPVTEGGDSKPLLFLNPVPPAHTRSLCQNNVFFSFTQTDFLFLNKYMLCSPSLEPRKVVRRGWT